MSKVTYDPTVDAARVYFSNNQIVDSESLTDDLIVDYDQDDNVVAVEILGVRRNKEHLKKALELLDQRRFSVSLSSLVEDALQAV